jgi:hypothetical protein
MYSVYFTTPKDERHFVRSFEHERDAYERARRILRVEYSTMNFGVVVTIEQDGREVFRETVE